MAMCFLVCMSNVSTAFLHLKVDFVNSPYGKGMIDAYYMINFSFLSDISHKGKPETPL
jgi:hypothetical protein